MYNRILLVGTMVDRPEVLYDTDANRFVRISLNVPSPPDAPPTYWGGAYALRAPDWPVGDNHFVVICRDPVLIEKCLQSFHKGDIVHVEGRLVLTSQRCDGELLPLDEILASNVILLAEHSSTFLQKE